jgi:hypothetical protein
MKKKIYIFTFFLSFVTICSAQNLISNPGFENLDETVTAFNNGNNVLLRVSSFHDDKTQILNPSSEETNVIPGMWVLKTFNSGYIRASVVSSGYKTGDYSLNLFIKQGSAQKTLENWYGTALMQRLKTPVSHSKKLKASAWIKVDDLAENQARRVTFFLTDFKDKQNLTQTVTLSGGKSWEKYDITFDVPAYVKRYRTADFSNAIFGIGISTLYDEDANSLYSGVHIDDLSLTVEE